MIPSITSLRVNRGPANTSRRRRGKRGASFTVGSYTWPCPGSGAYRFVQWGPGASFSTGTDGGASGAHTQTVVTLDKGQTVSIVIGTEGTDTVVTLPGGRVVTAGAALTSGPGTASGGDVNLNGSFGGAVSTPGAAGLGDSGGAGGPGDVSQGGAAGAPGANGYYGGSPSSTPVVGGVGAGGRGSGQRAGIGMVIVAPEAD